MVRQRLPMKHQGTIENWDDERGFGFVTRDDGGPRVFVHIKSIRTRGRRPVDGDTIIYDVEFDSQQRAQAINVRFLEEVTSGSSISPMPHSLGIGYFFGLAFVGLLTGLSVWRVIPVWMPLIYLAMSVITMFVYASDKIAAIDDRWRTAENLLQALALFGGWPGALLAQKVFRHKTSKRSFQTVFWLVVWVNCGVFAWTVSRPEMGSLPDIISSLQNLVPMDDQFEPLRRSGSQNLPSEGQSGQLPRIIPLNQSRED